MRILELHLSNPVFESRIFHSRLGNPSHPFNDAFTERSKNPLCFVCERSVLCSCTQPWTVCTCLVSRFAFPMQVSHASAVGLAKRCSVTCNRGFLRWISSDATSALAAAGDFWTGALLNGYPGGVGRAEPIDWLLLDQSMDTNLYHPCQGIFASLKTGLAAPQFYFSFQHRKKPCDLPKKPLGCRFLLILFLKTIGNFDFYSAAHKSNFLLCVFEVFSTRRDFLIFLAFDSWGVRKSRRC